MACYHPISGYVARSGGFTVSKKAAWVDRPMSVPCGQCIGCRLDQTRDWMIRITHESQMHPTSCFLTLTYDDDHLPPGNDLDHRHIQLFFKKLRNRTKKNIRYYMVGEYGDEFLRPHYHICLFGYDFPDKKEWRTRYKKGQPVTDYRSDELETIWLRGHAEITELNERTAAYAARYCTKKLNGNLGEESRQRLDPLTGEIYLVKPEYSRMSLNPAIGKTWLEKYYTDVFPCDHVVINGKERPTPKYYLRLLSLWDEKAANKIKGQRKPNPKNSTPERLAVRKKIALANLKNLKRTLK